MMKFFLIVVFVFLIALDQVSKSFYSDRVVVNQGFAFGINRDKTSLGSFEIFQSKSFNLFLHGLILSILVVIFFKNFSDYDQPVIFSFVFLFSGGVSNLIDRLFYQGVRDWLHLPMMNLKNNFADIYVNLAVLILLVLNIKWLIQKKQNKV